MGVDLAFQTASTCLQPHPTMSGRIDGQVLHNQVWDSVSFSAAALWVLSDASGFTWLEGRSELRRC